MTFEFRFFMVLGLYLVFYFLAANTGSGWLYLLSASLLTVMLLGISLPLLLVFGVDAQQNAPGSTVAGQPLTAILKLKAKLPLNLPVQWLRLGYDFDGTEGTARPRPLVLDSVGPTQTAWSITLDNMIRGVYHLGTIDLSTCFPVGVAWAHRRIAAGPDLTVTVYPRIVPIDGYFLFKLRPSLFGSSGASRSAHQSTSTRGVREYIRGDSPRIVHWASSARTGRLLVREFEAEGLPRFDVLLDLGAQWANSAQFELAVVTASSLLSMGHRMGIGPQLILHPDIVATMNDLPPTTPGVQTHMEVLARVAPVVSSSGSAWEQLQDLYLGNPERTMVIIRPESDKQLSGEHCYLIEIGTGEVSRLAHPHSSRATSFAGPKSLCAMQCTLYGLEDIENL